PRGGGLLERLPLSRGCAGDMRDGDLRTRGLRLAYFVVARSRTSAAYRPAYAGRPLACCRTCVRLRACVPRCVPTAYSTAGTAPTAHTADCVLLLAPRRGAAVRSSGTHMQEIFPTPAHLQKQKSAETKSRPRPGHRLEKAMP